MGDQSEGFFNGGGDDQPIKRVPMDERKNAEPFQIRGFDWQYTDIISDTSLFQIRDRFRYI